MHYAMTGLTVDGNEDINKDCDDFLVDNYEIWRDKSEIHQYCRSENLIIDHRVKQYKPVMIILEK